MRRIRVFVDVRRHRGDSRTIIGLVNQFCSAFQGAAIEWLGRPDQGHLLPSDHILGLANQFDNSWVARIRERLISEAQNDADGSFWVLSYDNALLAQCATAGAQVNTKHLSELIVWSRSRPGAVAATGRELNSGSLSLQEATALTKQVLREGAHTSPETALMQKDLRPALVYLDKRAQKRFGEPASERLVTDVVDRGMQAGWLKRFRRAPDKTGTEALYLADGEPQFILPYEEPSTSKPASADAAARIPASVQQPSLSLPAVVAAATTNGEGNPAPESTQLHRKFPNRASEFEKKLSEARIGGMPETRDYMFDAVSTVLSGRSDNLPSLPELFSEAGKLARETAEKAGHESEKNWTVAEKCVRRLMLVARVLLNDKLQPIRDTIGCNSSPVKQLLSPA